MTPGAWARISGCEKGLLRDFKERLDEAGLDIPTVSPEVFGHNTSHYGGNPEPESWPLWALARHHGLPTSLLDWTRRSLNAAYFAAAEAAKPETKSEIMCVWALQKPKPDIYDSLAIGRLSFYQPPNSSNPNLHAQAGLVTILNVEDMLPIDRYLEENEELLSKKKDMSPPVMRKFSLPREQTPRLLRLLSHEGIDGASMFPGYDGIAKCLRERALYG